MKRENVVTAKVRRQRATVKNWQIVYASHFPGTPDQLIDFSGSYDDAWTYAEEFRRNMEYKLGWYVATIQPKRGGKRPGAGTKVRAAGGAKVVKRVSPELADKLDAIQPLLARLKDWQARAEDASPTSPRWEQCRKLLNEISELWRDETC